MIKLKSWWLGFNNDYDNADFDDDYDYGNNEDDNENADDADDDEANLILSSAACEARLLYQLCHLTNHRDHRNHEDQPRSSRWWG